MNVSTQAAEEVLLEHIIKGITDLGKHLNIVETLGVLKVAEHMTIERIMYAARKDFNDKMVKNASVH